MNLLQIIFMVINCVSLILLGVGYFKSRFTIVDLETWNTLVECYNKHVEEEEGVVDNCGGGCGFFYDQLPQDIDEDEEEEPEDE